MRSQKSPRRFTLRNLSCNRDYRIAVRAVNRAGRRSRPARINISTLVCPPSNATLPAVSGMAVTGETLVATPGSWRGTPVTLAYQWVRCSITGGSCAELGTETDPQYTVATDDAGSLLRVRVRARNSTGAATATSAPVGPVEDLIGDPTELPPAPAGCSVAGTADCVPGTTLTLRDAGFFCNRPLSSYGQLPLKVVIDFTPGVPFGGNGAVDLYSGCAGDGNPDTIDLIVDVEGDGRTYGPGVDAFKVRQAAGYDAGIQVTGHVDCGPRFSPMDHQDGVQLQGGRDITFVDFSVGDYANGRSTCQGAGGAFFYSGASGYTPVNVDVIRGSYIACNHSLFIGSGTGDVIAARFRSGRTDGSDPVCSGYHASPACDGGAPGVRLVSVLCETWNRTSRTFE